MTHQTHVEEVESLLERGNSYRSDLGCCGGDLCEGGHNKQLVEAIAKALAATEFRVAGEIVKAVERVNRAENSTRQDLEDVARSAAEPYLKEV